MSNRAIDQDAVVQTLNGILELELAGVVRYMHYSFMVFGPNRIPVVKWMRTQSEEGMGHAAEAGEFITALGGHPSLRIGKLLETEKHSITQILEESVEHEEGGLVLYHTLLEQTAGRDVGLEEFARAMIAEESKHVSEIRKMLRNPPE